MVAKTKITQEDINDAFAFIENTEAHIAETGALWYGEHGIISHARRALMLGDNVDAIISMAKNYRRWGEEGVFDPATSPSEAIRAAHKAYLDRFDSSKAGEVAAVKAVSLELVAA